jgi:hypothetical protein
MIDCGDGTPDTALLYLEAAIRIMDSCSAPPEIAAHADLAKVRLEDWLASLGAAGAISSPFTISTREDFVGH